MNILFTNFCNKNCPYCFAQGKLIFSGPLKENYINIKNLKIIADFLKKSKERMVGIIGGEPTLHPQFPKFIKFLSDRGLFLRIFSNGIILPKIVYFLRRLNERKWNMLVNVNEPATYFKKEWATLNRAIALLSGQVQLGFNIYRPDFDMNFIVGLIEKYGLKRTIRLGVASPLFGGNNSYLKLGGHRKIAKKIADFADKIKDLNIKLDFDCGFISCSFTDNQLGRLVRAKNNVDFSCRPVIDVGPDLTVWRCFATSMIWNKKLTDFKNLDAAYEFFQVQSLSMRRVGATKKCFRCKELEFNRCEGGCLGHTLQSFKIKADAGISK